MTNIVVIIHQGKLLGNGGSICSGFLLTCPYILEKLAGKKKRHQLDFRRELPVAKQLIAGYNGYKQPSNSGERAIKTVTKVKCLSQGLKLIR